MSITKDDFTATYVPGTPLNYTIVVTNNSAVAISGITVTDVFPAQISSTTWTCIVPVPDPATKCMPSGGGGSLIATVSLAAGASITYEVTANVSAFAVGTLSNTASAAIPSGYAETNLANNTDTDSDTPTGTAADPNIGPPDGSFINPGPGGSVTLVFSPAIIANGDVGTPDFVYYEVTVPSFPTLVNLDWVKIEISADGSFWYEIFYWGNLNSDTNTNVALSLVGDICQASGVPTETDNCSIPTSRLYNATGITVDIDTIVPSGNYPWVKISGVGGTDGPDIDAIQPYYP